MWINHLSVVSALPTTHPAAIIKPRSPCHLHTFLNRPHSGHHSQSHTQAPHLYAGLMAVPDSGCVVKCETLIEESPTGIGLSGTRCFCCLVRPVCVENLFFPGSSHWILTVDSPVCAPKLPDVGTNGTFL